MGAILKGKVHTIKPFGEEDDMKMHQRPTRTFPLLCDVMQTKQRNILNVTVAKSKVS